jgi:heat shock protein HslJ
MTRRLLAVLPLLAIITAASADEGTSDTGTSTDPADLTGVSWRLVAGSISALAADAPPEAVVTIAFEDGQVHGTAACNSYFGAYEAGDDGSISFDALGQTEMACEEPLMALEASYLDALARATTFGVDGVLGLSGGGIGLTFSEEIQPEPLPLVGTTWTLATFAIGDAVSSTVAGTETTVELLEDGMVVGTTGCNRYHGTYVLDGDRLSFSTLASTKMLCADDITNQEVVFLDAMAAVRRFTIEGTQLSLTDDGGTLLLAFEGAGSTAT